MVKIIKKYHKKIKDLEKTKKGITKAIKTKLEDFEKLKLVNPKIKSYKEWQIYKIYSTSSYGDYRIIIAENKIENKLVCNFYFKNEKNDLSAEEYKEIKAFLENCCDDTFFANLDDF